VDSRIKHTGRVPALDTLAVASYTGVKLGMESNQGDSCGDQREGAREKIRTDLVNLAPSSRLSLDGRVAIVTGGGTGIGCSGQTLWIKGGPTGQGGP
jgi:hypothetical protein